MASESVWRGRYDRWKASGLSLHEFGLREKVKAVSLPWWVRRMRQFEREIESTSMTFVRVSEGEFDDARVTPDLEVVLPNSLRVRVPGGASLRQVVELVGALGEIPSR